MWDTAYFVCTPQTDIFIIDRTVIIANQPQKEKKIRILHIIK